MTPAAAFAGRRVALFGLGGSGLVTALALKAGGAEVVAFDDSTDSLARAQAQGIETADLRQADWSGFAALVLAPGIPLTHPAPHWSVRMAQSAKIEIIGDIELFCRERTRVAPDAPFVAITGTNGKSTTTALLAHILREAGRDVQMGGNIGTAILSLAPPANDRVHVIEMSSFQIDLTPSFVGSNGRHPEEAGAAGRLEGRTTVMRASRRASGTPQHDEGERVEKHLGPTIGVLMNITPDHLDRHGTLEHYAAIKERLVAGADFAVVGIDDEPSRAIAERRGGRDLVRVSVERPLDDGVFAQGSTVLTAQAGEREAVLDLSGIASLRGAHNAQNAAVAFAVCRHLGLDAAAIGQGMRSFPGLAHRMEEIARRGRVIFINDSKATNADSTEKALSSFDSGIFWILGGKAKDGGIKPLRPYFGRVERAYLIGEASDAFAATLEGAVSFERCGTLDVAVASAARDALASKAREPVVLLSPACASYDQYRNFEIRGDHFRALVKALP